jgi:hypothetical protein
VPPFEAARSRLTQSKGTLDRHAGKIDDSSERFKLAR